MKSAKSFSRKLLILLVIVAMMVPVVSVPTSANAPASPTGLFASGVTANAATLSWQNSAGTSRFEIWGRIGSGTDTKMADVLNTGAANKMDVVFIVDRTGSMGSYISNVRTNITSFTNQLSTGGVDYRLGLVSYSDSHPTASMGEPGLNIKSEFTSNVTTFQNSLNAINVSGGGDLPESGLEAIDESVANSALTFSFRSDAAKHFILVTDALVHDNNDGDSGNGFSTLDIDTIANKLKDQNIRLHAITSSTIHTQQLNRLTTPTNGTFMSITGNFSTSLSTLGSNVVTTRSHTLTGLQGSTTYTVNVRACHAAPSTVCSTPSTSATFTTLDGSPPTAPTGLVVDDGTLTTSGFRVSWNAATDNVGVAGYDVYNGTTLVGSTTAAVRNFTFSGLSGGTTHSITVKAKDAAGNVSAASSALSVTTVSPNQDPTNITLSSNTIAEGVAANTEVGTLSATDPDDTVFTYQLVQGQGDNDNSSFSIVGNSLKINNTPDLEIQESYSILIRVSDDDGKFFEKIFVITVTGINEAPTAISLSNKQVDENYWIGYQIGTLLTTDPDAGDTHTYALVDGEGDADNMFFAIDGDKLEIAADLDFKEDYVHSIRVKSTDSSGLTVEQPLEVDVLQANVLLNNTFNQLTIFFQERISNNKTDLEQLKDQITISKNAADETPTYEDLKDTTTVDGTTTPGDSISIKNETLIIRFATPLTAGNYRIKIAEGALKDINTPPNVSTEQTSSPFYVDGAGPQVVSTKVNKRSNTITVTFNKAVTLDAGIGATVALRTAALKVRTDIQRNSSTGLGSYIDLGQRDNISVAGRILTVRLNTALTHSNNNLKIQADTLRDIGGNKNAELIIDVDRDTTGPTLSRVAVSGKNKVISIFFKDGALNNFTGATRVEQLKAAFTVSRQGGAYEALGATDSVAIVPGQVNGQINVTLNTALAGSNNRIKINAGALKDSFGNTNSELITSSMTADEIGPTVVQPPKEVFIRANTGNKIINLTFNERLFNPSTATTAVLRTNALKASIQLTQDADVATPVFANLATADKVSLKGRTIIISLAKALPANKNFQVRVLAPSTPPATTISGISDLAGNTNAEITTGKFTIDKSGPKMRSN